MYKVYWIRRECHTDILSEGYVGITSNLDNRMVQHQYRAPNEHLRRALSLYDDIVVDVISYDLSKADAAAQEKQLRPLSGLGWNVAPGGDVPPPIKGRRDIHRKISDTIKKLGVTPYCENSHSPEAIEKRKASREQSKHKWYHDPNTLEFKMIKTAVDCIPDGWAPGRKPRAKKDHLVRGVDYISNQKTWKLYVNKELVFEGSNLKGFMKCNYSDTIYPMVSSTAKSGQEYWSKRFDVSFRCEIIK